MTALISFLGGSAFRLVFGAIMDWFNRQQDHAHEVALLRAQADLDAARHQRDLDRIKLQADLKVTEVKIVADAAEQQAMNTAFIEAVRATTIKTGNSVIDAWNGSIRPAGATIALLLWIGSLVVADMRFSDFDRELIAAFLGVFVGDRIHARMSR